MKDNKLEVGDFVYLWKGSFDSYLSRQKVVRLTPKRAVLKDGTQVTNELRKGGDGYEEELNAPLIGSYGQAHLSNDRLDSIYKEQRIRNKAKQVYNAIQVKNLSGEECQLLISAFSHLLSTT